MNRGMRSQTYRVDLGHGCKPWVILSNNSRNRNLDTVLAARITTTSKNAHVPTVVPLTAADPVVGFVLVDDIVQLYHISDHSAWSQLNTFSSVLRKATIALVAVLGESDFRDALQDLNSEFFAIFKNIASL